MSEFGTLYKVLEEDGSAQMGTGTWHLPNAGPGRWMPRIPGELIPCQRGYHLCQREDLVEWLGPAIFTAEHRGEVVIAKDKIVVAQARLLTRLETWNDRTARLFACDCAEHVLDAIELKSPSDPRSLKAIEIARRFARSEATADELDAARDTALAAAWTAAWTAALAATRAAEKQWQTIRLFSYLEGDVS